MITIAANGATFLGYPAHAAMAAAPEPPMPGVAIRNAPVTGGDPIKPPGPNSPNLPPRGHVVPLPPAPARDSNAPYIVLVPMAAPPRQLVSMYGRGFCAAGCSPVAVSGRVVVSGMAVSPAGTLHARLTVVEVPQRYTVTAVQTAANGATLAAAAPLLVPVVDVHQASAWYSFELGEYLLRYEDVRTAGNPDAVLLDFLQRTYAATAALAGWERAALERS